MGDTPKPRFPRGTERSVTDGRDQRGSREEDPPPEGGGATDNPSARSFPPVRSPAQSRSALSGRKLPRPAGGPRNGRGPQHLVQVGAGIPRAGRSRLTVPAGTARQSAAEDGGRGEDESRRVEASSSRLGHPEDQPVSAARVVSAGEPRNGSPHVARAAASQKTPAQASAQSTKAALLRALHAQPDVADRYLHLPAGRQERLPDRLSG
jgi:hypothetical protein